MAARRSRSPSGWGSIPRIVADARSRLSENERAFEETLARIRTTEGETSEALDRARAAELRAAESLRQADEERRRARQERDELVQSARNEAERLVADLRDDVKETRRSLERETVTAPGLDAAVARAEGRLDLLPDAPPEPPPPARVPHEWRLGERARSMSGGWEGRIAALERGGRRATLEAGGMRVTVDVDDLELSAPGSIGRRSRVEKPGDTGTTALGLDRARSVASSLDLRGARVDEALEALGRYLDDASLAGLDKVLIIHGQGTGALRDAVRAEAGSHPLVKAVRAGERGEGGDGASIVTL